MGRGNYGVKLQSVAIGWAAAFDALGVRSGWSDPWSTLDACVLRCGWAAEQPLLTHLFVFVGIPL